MEEIYIEQTSPKTIVKTLIMVFFVLGILIGGYLYFHNSNILRVKNVVIELGEKVPTEIDFYVKNKIRNINDFHLNVLKVSVDDKGYTDEVGKFKYTVKFDSQEKAGIIEVKDTTEPEVTLKELTVGISEKFPLNDFLKTCTDKSLPCSVSLADSDDEKLFSKVGTHTIKLSVSDKYGNNRIMSTNVTVSNVQTLLTEKTTDFEVVKTMPQYDDYDGTITLKYESAVSEAVLDEIEEYNAYLELVSTDYNELREQEVVEQEVLTLYNKYDYIIGFAVRLTYSDGTIEYVR